MPLARRRWPELVALADWSPPAFRSSAGCVELGIAPGPGVGMLLRELESWWIAGDFAADRAACLAELKRRVSGSGG